MNAWEIAQQGFWAFVATAGFGVLFNVPTYNFSPSNTGVPASAPLSSTDHRCLPEAASTAYRL